MKSFIYSSLFILLAIFSINNVQAQQESNKHNYVVLTKKVPQLQPILLTAKNLQEEDGLKFGDFQVIICGKMIGEITEPLKMEEFLIEAEKLGVELVACGFSLNKFKVDKAKVPGQMKVVENGILYNFQLQKKGYKSISL